eukprot:CAMPEP_0115142708 /NCGR_PEP_ID=MMETSP0227-20121206/60322_1 /TAXON_ID=89957 /ORGANISM="Polarella glacialis, Strain CCMP 1383" /LENGTH=58 /DNA_ID=CAMNT_0002551369 /DNA_START=268 /DNA_END=441 /DNA_ORIENTATION=-
MPSRSSSESSGAKQQVGQTNQGKLGKQNKWAEGCCAASFSAEGCAATTTATTATTTTT